MSEKHFYQHQQQDEEQPAYEYNKCEHAPPPRHPHQQPHYQPNYQGPVQPTTTQAPSDSGTVKCIMALLAGLVVVTGFCYIQGRNIDARYEVLDQMNQERNDARLQAVKQETEAFSALQAKSQEDDGAPIQMEKIVHNGQVIEYTKGGEAMALRMFKADEKRKKAEAKRHRQNDGFKHASAKQAAELVQQVAKDAKDMHDKTIEVNHDLASKTLDANKEVVNKSIAVCKEAIKGISKK